MTSSVYFLREVPLISDENGKSVLHGVAHTAPYGCGINATYPGNVFTSVYSMINFVDEVIVSNYTGCQDKPFRKFSVKCFDLNTVIPRKLAVPNSRNSLTRGSNRCS